MIHFFHKLHKFTRNRKAKDIIVSYYNMIFYIIRENSCHSW